MAELKRQNGGGGSEPPSSAEKKQKHAEGDVSATPSSAAEKSKNGAEPPPSSAADKSRNGAEPPPSSAAEKSKNGTEPPPSSLPPSSAEKNIQKLTTSVDKWSLTPNDEGYAEFFYRELKGSGDIDEILPPGATKDQRPDFVKIWVNYDRQIFNSKGFECKDYPSGCFDTSVYPLTHPTARQTKSMMELANLAIQEYNEKECNVFKYEVLKIEKANAQLTSVYQYYMTVKVLNTTLGSLIETFLIHAAEGIDDDSFSKKGIHKEVFSCKPKVKVAPDIVHHDFHTPMGDAAHHD